MAELLVAYGVYANKESCQNFHEWQLVNEPQPKNPKAPKKFAVKFIGIQNGEDEEE